MKCDPQVWCWMESLSRPGPADWEAMQLLWFVTSQLSSGNYEIGPASTGDMYMYNLRTLTIVHEVSLD